MKIRRGTESINEEARDNGDIDGIVYRIKNTGDPSVYYKDRYRHTINHNLNREPIGCMIIQSDDFVNVKVIEKDSNKIIVQFDTARADVTLEIW